MTKRAITTKGTSVGPRGTHVPILSEQEMAVDFSAVILPFATGDLARSAKRGKEAAKKWKAARSLPSFWSIVNLARSNPVIRTWVLAHLNVNPDFNSPQFLTMAAAAMYQLAHQDDPAGDAMREFFAKMGKDKR